ncbi:MAG: carboxylating nicotinate-nucleotide diphosphorylase [Rickettsiaceae bacterium]
MQLNIGIISKLLDNSLIEDYGIGGDVTSESVIKDNKKIDFLISARQNIVLCGSQIAHYYLQKYSSAEYKLHFEDSENIKAKEVIISGKGPAKDILLLERVILNYLQHLSGIATITNSYVQAVVGTKARIYDTRKTVPMLRQLQKYAVRCGGGYNHRLAMDSSILIKDNHIAICGGITQAINNAKKVVPHYTKIEVECDTLVQVREAVTAKADIIMLDNMSISSIEEAIKLINGGALIEVSGNVSLDTVQQIAKTGVDIISVGKITHSSPAVDIGLDIL